MATLISTAHRTVNLLVQQPNKNKQKETDEKEPTHTHAKKKEEKKALKRGEALEEEKGRNFA